jgi:phage tail-like protein
LNFAVLFSDDRPAYFRSVSGTPAYRRDPRSRPIRTPSRPRLQNITLHAGILSGNAKLLKWCEQARTAPVERNNLTIQLLNESGAVTMTWTVVNAWPMKLSGATGGENEVAVEAIELGFESMTVSQ